MHLESYVAYEKEQPITDSNIKELVVKKDKLKIRDYNSLSSKDSLHSLLPSPGTGCVLFWRNKKSEIGHFNLLMRHQTSGAHDNKFEFEFFDSYGFTIQEVAAKTSHDGGRKLLDIIKGHRIFHGRHKFQSRTGDVNTCGRYVAFRFNCEAFSYNRFKHLLQYKGLHPDDLITLLTISVDFAHLNKNHHP